MKHSGFIQRIPKRGFLLVAALLVTMILVIGCGEKQTTVKSEEQQQPPVQQAQTQPTVEGKKDVETAEVKPPESGDQKPSKTYSKDEPHPIISFEKLEHDFGESKQNQDLVYNFKFKNTGERELEVVNVKGG